MTSAESRSGLRGVTRAIARATRGWVMALAAVVLVAGCKDSTGNTTVASIRFATLPTSIVAGQPFTVVVELLNPSDAVADGSGASVTLRLIGTAVLGGETTVNAVRGVATFDGLTLTIASSATILEAEVGTGANAIAGQSSSFAVTAAAASGQQSTVEAPETPIFPFAPTELTFTFKDQYGNALAAKAASVTSSLAGSTLDPSSGTTDAAGRFTTAFDPGGEGSATFTATVDGTTVTLAAALTAVDLCPPAPIAIGQVINGQAPTGDCTMGAAPAAAYRFTTAASGLQLSSNAAFPRLLQVLTDPPATHLVVIAESETPVEWLLPAGTFRLQVGALSGQGPFAVTTTAVAGNTPGDQIPALIGPIRLLTTAGNYATQALTAGDVDFYDDQTRADFFLIFSSRPCRIRMIPDGFHAWLDLFDYNALVAGAEGFRVNADGNEPSIDLPFGCRGGPNGPPLLIVANNFLAGLAGSYTLEVTFITPPPALRANATVQVPSALEPIWEQPIRIRPMRTATRIKRR